MIARRGVEEPVQGYGADGLRREGDTGDFLIEIAASNGVVPFDKRHGVEVIAGGTKHPVEGTYI